MPQNCDPALLNEALWGEYQNWEQSVFHCNKPYFLQILMQKWLPCDIPLKSYEHHHHLWYHHQEQRGWIKETTIMQLHNP